MDEILSCVVLHMDIQLVLHHFWKRLASELPLHLCRELVVICV